MNTPKLLFLFLFYFATLSGQSEPTSIDEIDLSDVVVIEDIEVDADTDSGNSELEPTGETGESTGENSEVGVPDAAVEPSSEDESEAVETAASETVDEANVENVTAESEVDAPEIPEATVEFSEESEMVLEIPGQESESGGEATKGEDEEISVDFPDEDVRNILRNVADLNDLNLVIPDTLQGRTSLKLKNVSWEDVFEVVLDPLGFTFIEERNIIRVKSVEELSTEPVDTRVFVVDFARAEEIQGSIAPLIDSAAGGKIKVDTRSNALVITERPSQMSKIQNIIDRLDRATDQVMIESKFIEVTQDDTKNIGVNWSSLGGYGLSAGPFQRSYSDAESDDYSRSRTAQNTDVDFITNRQDLAGDVVSRARPSSPVLPAPSNIDDINDAIASGDPVPGPIYDNFGGESNLSDVFSRVTTTTDSAVFSAEQFRVILSALKTNNDIKLVSNPTVVTLDNKLAKIAIGEKFPIPQYSFNQQTGERQLDGIEYEDIGITLDVTPQVNSAGFINLNIVPEVSSRLGVAIVEGTEIPIIASRRTETSIMIKDGFTLAIGGLSENEISRESTKVPVLGSLPGVGRLFRSESDRLEQRNLIIFITAKTLNPDGSTYRDVIDPRMLDEMEITPSEIPGYQVSEEYRSMLQELEDYRNEAELLKLSGSARERLDKIKEIEKKKEEAAAKAAAEAEAQSDGE